MSRKLKSPFVLVSVPVVLVVIIIMALTNPFASALDGAQWETIRGYMDAYITAQYDDNGTPADPADDPMQGEGGFQVDQAWLKARIDSNGDGVYLGEGDDAANAPVLVDNLEQLDTAIPGTNVRCRWNTDCFEGDSIALMAAAVNKHEAAGFSTDIVDYCVTNHTASPTTGAWGFLAQTGGLGGTTPPNVYGFKWGRNGWTDTLASYTNTEPLGAAAAAGTFGLATNALDCSAATTDAELVACAADWAVDALGGNVGNGKTPPITAAQVIDVRADSPASTIPGAIQIPYSTVFDLTTLPSIDPAATTLVASRTQGGGGIIAVGLRMLGYNLDTATGGGFLNGGMPGYNNTLDEKQVATGNAYPLDTVAVLAAPAAMDTTAPVITSGPSATPGSTTAIISRTADGPATMRVEYGTTSGVYTDEVNDTVLNAAKSVNLNGLTPGTTYFYQVTSYDSHGNATVSAEDSFVTTEQPDPLTDKVYYLPWYDSRPAGGWIGDWIGVVNMDATDTADVEIRIGGVMMDRQVAIPANGGDWDPQPASFANLIGGPVEVICWDCVTNGTTLVVNQRALYGQSFSEILAVEGADLGTTYVFPWYDNIWAAPNNVRGAWVMVTNTDLLNPATVEITIDGNLVDTMTVPPGQADYYIDPTFTLMGGPVLVQSTGPEKIIVSQRVLYLNSFNEILGQKIQ